LSSRLLSKNVKIGTYKTAKFACTFYGCGTWSLTSTEEHGLRMFEDRALRRTLGHKRVEVKEGGENGIIESFITCTPDQIS
jgi:hypothetical protein